MHANNLHLILAEDDRDDSDLFVGIIKKISNNIVITVTENGKQLMSYLNDESADLPDLLFLDLNMPGMNGFECLKEIKTNSRLRHIPVVVFTTSDHFPDIKKAHYFGGDFYIQKPNNYDDLFEVFETQLKKID